MGATLAKNSEIVTVHTMNPVPPRGQVFYASLSSDSETPKGFATQGAGARHHLVSILWDHCAAMESSPWKDWRSMDRAVCPIQVVSGLLGRPQLHLGESRGPAISFSRGGGKIWAALSGDESAVGIDVAGSAEFQGAYPLQRVFHPEELHHAVEVTVGDQAEAAALLWSVKEAVVKALGCGFHLVDPRHISVYPSAGGNGGYTFPVGLSGKALARFPLASGQFLRVHSLLREKMWLSIAVIKRRQVVHE